jgi:superfamily I DNA and RNA helicase
VSNFLKVRAQLTRQKKNTLAESLNQKGKIVVTRFTQLLVKTVQEYINQFPFLFKSQI